MTSSEPMTVEQALDGKLRCLQSILQQLVAPNASNAVAEARETIATLAAQVEALRANDARYRWLRGRVPGSAYRIAGVIYSEGGDGVDAAIDAAMGHLAGREGA